MKIYTNSKGESLPKVICAVVDFEKARLKDTDSRISLVSTLVWNKSNIFGQDSQGNYNKWDSIYKGNYEDFYIVFPTCKNSRGQELPEEIQVEIVEERLRQWDSKITGGYLGFVWVESVKGQMYWNNIYHHTELPTKSDEFTQGEIVEVSYNNKSFAPAIYIAKFKESYIAVEEGVCDGEDCAEIYPFVRKKAEPKPLELTLPELLTIAEEVKRTKVKLKS